MSDIDTSIKRDTARRVVVEGQVQGAKGSEPGLVTMTEWLSGEGWDLGVGDRPVLGIHDSELDLVKLAIETVNVDANTVRKKEE